MDLTPPELQEQGRAAMRGQQRQFVNVVAEAICDAPPGVPCVLAAEHRRQAVRVIRALTAAVGEAGWTISGPLTMRTHAHCSGAEVR